MCLLLIPGSTLATRFVRLRPAFVWLMDSVESCWGDTEELCTARVESDVEADGMPYGTSASLLGSCSDEEGPFNTGSLSAEGLEPLHALSTDLTGIATLQGWHVASKLPEQSAGRCLLGRSLGVARVPAEDVFVVCMPASLATPGPGRSTECLPLLLSGGQWPAWLRTRRWLL